ncbi:MAG: hypothetical protein CMB99_15910 [Flavobacteriaceae bacterium]|jgi:hypothetical protein|nr:hypothetical protein [Flavobacteriaceae bacterium]|tara:strand:+ start:7126 stop:7632 length:507 start_codon:yes stop_codon:yes gene_type:complete
MSNPSRWFYITEAQFAQVLTDLNVNTTEADGYGVTQQEDLIDRAVGDLESDLVKRFVVPLVATNGAEFSTSAPYYTRQKVLNAIKAKIRQILGSDNQKNIVIDSSERYIDLKKAEYTGHIKDLLDHEREFGLRLQSYASDGAKTPVQSVAISRPDDSMTVDPSSDYYW